MVAKMTKKTQYADNINENLSVTDFVPSLGLRACVFLSHSRATDHFICQSYGLKKGSN